MWDRFETRLEILSRHSGKRIYPGKGNKMRNERTWDVQEMKNISMSRGLLVLVLWEIDSEAEVSKKEVHRSALGISPLTEWRSGVRQRGVFSWEAVATEVLGNPSGSGMVLQSWLRMVQNFVPCTEQSVDMGCPKTGYITLGKASLYDRRIPGKVFTWDSSAANTPSTAEFSGLKAGFLQPPDHPLATGHSLSKECRREWRVR